MSPRGLSTRYVAVHADKPDQSAAKPRVQLLLRCVVIAEGDGVGQRVTGLALSPVDDL